MSKRGERLAAEYVSELLSSAGIQKAAGSASPALLMVAVTPLMEQLVTRDRHIRKTTKAIRRQQKTLEAIAAPQAPTVSPMRLPAQPRMVPMRAEEWRTQLVPADEPLRNGHHHQAEDRNPAGAPPDGHPG